MCVEGRRATQLTNECLEGQIRPSKASKAQTVG